MSPRDSSASVVIPTRDRAALVELAVESALAARGVAEVIVVDNGSTDDTRERLARFGAAVRVITAGLGGGPASARNAGAAVARAPLLAFLDSDDEMLPGKVPCLARRFGDPRVGLAHGRIEVIDEGGRPDPARTRAHEALFRRAEEVGTGYAALARHCAMFTSATVMRAEAFKQVGGYDEALTDGLEDLDLYLRLSPSWTLVYEGCPVARYRVWRGNVGWAANAAGVIAVARKHLALLDATLPPGERDEARYWLLRRLAFASHTLLRASDARRFAAWALRARPAAALSDPAVARLLAASFLPRRVLARRRPSP